VLGQAHTPRRRLWPFVAFALVVLTAPAVSGANPSHSVSALRAQDAAIVAQSRSAVLGLYALDQRLAGARAQLRTLDDRSRSLSAERATLRLELQVARHSTVYAQQQLAQQLRTSYEQGNVEPLEILFGAKNLEEAMTNIDDLSRISTQGEDILAQLKTARSRLAVASRELATRETALAAARRAAEATTAALVATRSDRTAYIASLAAKRRLTANQIAEAIARAHEAQLRTAAAAPPSPTPSAGPAPDAVATALVPPGRTITVLATGYALGGRTSTGLPVGWGIAAVDPSVIPLGTHMTVPGYGETVAADVGGAVRGSVIDLWFPTVAQANAWGRRTVTIVLH
jgi:3D (Asp-Asp-Asp) domain-containing protein/peptidoglycan hydrolase CwlO-like protein